MIEVIVSVMERTGYAAIALLMFVENVFPPIPSELIMPLAGFAVARGDPNAVGVVAAGGAGPLAGAVLWYVVGRSVGADRLKRLASRHGRWLTLGPKEIDTASDWFHRHGPPAVLLGRLVPAVRTLASVPAGIARISPGAFLFYSSLGTIAWTAVLTFGGYLLESGYTRIADWVNPISTGVVVALIGLYVYRVAAFDRCGSDAGDASEP